MKNYQITMPFTGYAVRTIEANSKEEALQQFNDDTIMSVDLNGGNVEHIEWDFTRTIVQGNVFYGIQNEMDIEVVDGEDEDEDEDEEEDEA
jgi:hypothetical protein